LPPWLFFELKTVENLKKEEGCPGTDESQFRHAMPGNEL
jgi:hypothetical protein